MKKGRLKYIYLFFICLTFNFPCESNFQKKQENNVHVNEHGHGYGSPQKNFIN